MEKSRQNKIKSESIFKAKHYYMLAYNEYQQNGDSNKRRDYIFYMISYINLYRINGGKRLGKNYKDYDKIFNCYRPLTELEEEYHEKLIFEPTIEDYKDMKYWI